jgi:hypothetical protein
MRPYLEKSYHKNRAGGVAQGEGSEFKNRKKTQKNKGRFWDVVQ